MDGTYPVTVVLRDGPDASDTAVHTETFPGTPVQSGLLTVTLGSVTPLAADAFAEPLWYSIAVASGTPGPLAPIRTVPVAVSAVRAGRVASGGPPCTGDASDLGALRMNGDTLQGCTSSGWTDLN